MKEHTYYECEICGRASQDVAEMQACEDSHKNAGDLQIVDVTHAKGRSHPALANGPNGYPAQIEVTSADTEEVAVYSFSRIKSEEPRAAAA